jgi:amino acid adenylation domain-containing protein
MSSNLSERINALSPQQRALFELRLKRTPLPSEKSLTIPKRAQWDNRPLSLDQENLWLIDQLEPGLSAYNLSTSFNLGGDLDMPALIRAVNEIVRRHEVLRTCFHSTDGMPVQVIAASLTLSIPVINLESLTDSSRALELKRLTNQFTRQPFNLAASPLLRVALVRLGEHEHIMLMTLHHIITDRWSFSILWRELTTLYAAFAAGQPSPLPELPIQFADFAVWQRQRLQGEFLESQLAFWRKQLEGASTILHLPTDRARPPLQTYEGERQYWKPDPKVWNKFKALSRQEGVTLYMSMLAAFGTLLYRYAGHDDINIGTPYANRHLVETEGLIGYLLNMLLLRINLAGNPTFRELLNRVREVTLNAYDYSEVPFAKIVEELQPQRDLSCNPLFQAAYVHHDLKDRVATSPTVSLKGLEIEACTSIFDLTLGLRDQPDNPTLIFEYKTRLFDAATITRMRGRFDTLLESIVSDPQRRLSELQMLSEAERHQLLVEFNDTETVYPQDLCLHQLFEQQVERTPDALALTFEDEHSTYAQLNSRANQLAHYLQEQGIGVEDRVGVLLERSIEMVVSLLAILKAGAAYVPLDPAYPLDRLLYMTEDARLRLLLTHSCFAEKFSTASVRQLCLDTASAVLSAHSTANPTCAVLPENPVYVIYTSGSTGRPKGVLSSHRAALNRFSWMWRHYPFEAGEVCCQKTSLSFVDSVWETLGPLLQGIPSIIIPDERLKEPAQFVDVLNQAGVTRIVLVPSLLRAMLDSNNSLSGLLTGMKYITCSGEAIDLNLWQQLRQKLPESALINLYGSSEVSADVTSYDSREGRWETCVPLGRPISNMSVYILDDWMEAVAVGVSGELYVGGDGLARGYLNQPGMTAERFVPHPFSTTPGARLYRTGDIGRYLEDGNIEFLGRADHQVKIRGFRIELGEIESVLTQHSQVREAVVAAQETGPAGGKGQRLVAYVVAEAGTQLQTSQLRQHLVEKLPEHMIPSVFVQLDEFPLTPNGKLNRRALPVPDSSRPDIADRFVAPTNPLEEDLAQMFSALLGVERVGIEDNFFELGGHSLLAMQLISRVRADFDMEIGLRDFFEAPTVTRLAEMMEAAFLATTEAGEIAEMLSELELIEEKAAQRMFTPEQENFE